MKKEMTTTATIDDFIIEDTQSVIVYSTVIGGLEMTISEETAPQDTDDGMPLDHLLEDTPAPRGYDEDDDLIDDELLDDDHTAAPPSTDCDQAYIEKIEREQDEMRNDFYALIFPGTRCETVSREDIADTIRDYLQQLLNQIASYPRTGRYQQIIDDQMDAYHACSYMVLAVFGLRACIIEDGRVTIMDMV